jgi:transposase, IS30 family
MSPADAGLAVGVSVRTGGKWFGQAGGVRPKFPDDGPRMRLRLSFDERVEIEVRIKTQESVRSMARRLGRAPSTIMREIDENAFSYGCYRSRFRFGRRGRVAGTPSRATAPSVRRPVPCTKRGAPS